MSKTIEEIAKQYVWEKNLGNIGINTFLKDSLFEPMYHIEIISERYSQSQTQELQEQNRDLFEMLKRVSRKSEIYEDGLREELEELLTNYNHLKSNTNETDKI